MASKSLILALALATTAGAKGIRGLNFGNYYDTCVTTDIEKENKCQDYSCRPGATLGADKEFGADANCGENYPEGKTACQADPDCATFAMALLPCYSPAAMLTKRLNCPNVPTPSTCWRCAN